MSKHFRILVGFVFLLSAATRIGAFRVIRTFRKLVRQFRLSANSHSMMNTFTGLLGGSAMQPTRIAGWLWMSVTPSWAWNTDKRKILRSNRQIELSKIVKELNTCRLISFRTAVSAAPAGFTAAIQAAAEVFEQDFSGNYTVNIDYGWGTMYNQPTPNRQNLRRRLLVWLTWRRTVNISYATVKSWLTAHATLPDQIAAVASLPASYTALPGDANAFLVSTAAGESIRSA